MTIKAASLAFIVAVFVALVPAGATAAGGGISPSCSPGCSSGWYQVPVVPYWNDQVVAGAVELEPVAE